MVNFICQQISAHDVPVSVDRQINIRTIKREQEKIMSTEALETHDAPSTIEELTRDNFEELFVNASMQTNSSEVKD